MSDGVYFVDRDRTILYWNKAASRLAGYSAEEILGRHCQDNILCHVDYEGHKLCLECCPLSASIIDGETHRASVFLLHKDGMRVPVSVRVQPIKNADGSIVGAVEIFSDNSAQIEAQRKLAGMGRLAFLDHLTQLPNRRFISMFVRSMLREYEAHKDPFAVLMFDIDMFKNINDSCGHECGDLALQTVAKTLSGSLRPSDIVGRWGGDEFLAIAKSVNHEILRTLAERCITLIRETAILIESAKPLSLSISVGAALVRSGDTVETLIHRADELMYQSKAAGRDCATTE